jgi:hypothetical protein
LPPPVAQVDDGEARMAEGSARIVEELTDTVGAAVLEPREHRPRRCALGWTAERDDSADAAHR